MNPCRVGKLVFVLAAWVALWPTPACGESWPLLGIYGYWGQLGVGAEFDYRRDKDVKAAKQFNTGEICLNGAGYLYHPYFVSWNGNATLGWGPENKLQNGYLQADVLPLHSTPGFLVIQRSQDQNRSDFLPERRSIVDSAEARLVLNAYRSPVFLKWAATESRTEGWGMPGDSLVRSYSIDTKQRIGRDNDVAFLHEGLNSTDLVSGTGADRKTTHLEWDSRWLYDLVTLRSSLDHAVDSGSRVTGLTRLTQELNVQNRADWSSGLTVQAEESQIDGAVAQTVEVAGRTGGRLGPSYQLDLEAKAERAEGGGVTKWGAGAGGQVGWDGAVGPVRLSARAGTDWYPTWAKGAYTFKVYHEPSKLWDPAEAMAMPLAHHRIILETIKVFLPRGLEPLTPGWDYEVRVKGESGGVADEVTILWLSTSDYQANEDVRVDYSYQVAPGNTERISQSASLSASTVAEHLSLGATTYWTRIREYSTAREDSARLDQGHTVQLVMVDGPFSLTTAVNRLSDGTTFQSSTFAWRRTDTTLSQAVERYCYEGGQEERRRAVTRVEYRLGQSGILRLQGFAQYRVGNTTGRQKSAERAVQAGVQASAFPAPNLRVSGSLSYLKDWVNQSYDQALADCHVEWALGQLSATLETELEEDLGRNAARGKINLGVVRRF